MGTLKKVMILVGGTLISFLIVGSLVDPTFATYLGEQVGFALGVVIAFSPILVFGFLLWFLFFKKSVAKESKLLQSDNSNREDPALKYIPKDNKRRSTDKSTEYGQPTLELSDPAYKYIPKAQRSQRREDSAPSSEPVANPVNTTPSESVRLHEAEDLLLKNPTFAVAYGIEHNKFAKETRGPDFRSYISNPQVIKVVDEAYRQTHREIGKADGASVFTQTIFLLIESMKPLSGAEEAARLAWGFNAARDIIFAFAPALAEADGKDVELITLVLMDIIIRQIEECDELGHFEACRAPLECVLFTYQDSTPPSEPTANTMNTTPSKGVRRQERVHQSESQREDPAILGTEGKKDASFGEPTQILGDGSAQTARSRSRALIAVKYREDIKLHFSSIEQLGSRYTDMYLDLLEEAPDRNADELFSVVKSAHKNNTCPFNDDQLNTYYQKLEEFGADAQSKFREIHSVLGLTFDGKLVFDNLAVEFAKHKISRPPKELTPGLYAGSGKIVFRIYENQSVLLIEKNGRKSYRTFPTLQEFWAVNGEEIGEVSKIRKL